MSEYQCSSCGREYSYRGYDQLDRVQAVKDEEDPTAPHGHGYHRVCECGHEFHADDWQKKTAVEAGEREFRVSTTHLVLNHGHAGEDYWYETCVFWDAGSYVLDRYTTEQEAEEGHEETVEAIRSGDFQVTDTEFASLSITDGGSV